MVEHFVSIDIEGGDKANVMVKAPLAQALRESIVKAPDDKHDCWLMSHGYSDKGGYYTRAEHNFQFIDTILLDFDNNKENPDPTLLDRFKKEHDKYSYFLWESASSTIECPKFRAILLLDDKVEWINEPEKFTKRAIAQHFAKWNIDEKASWFFTPTKSKVSTFVGHKGVSYPSYEIRNLMKLGRDIWDMNQPSISHQWDIENLFSKRGNNNQKDGWRFLPSVKKCLDGMSVHTKHNSICSAVYAMEQCGYHDAIPDFLQDVSSQITKKHYNYWYNKWKRNNV